MSDQTQALSARRPRGRPTKLTDEAERVILSAIRSHQRPDVGAELAGVGLSTYYGWCALADELRVRIKRGESIRLTDYQKRLLEFSDAVEREKARAEAVAVKGIMDGGLNAQVERRQHTRCMGLTKDGEPIMVTETTTVERPPDADNLKFWLERRIPRHYGRRQEITGPDGGPLEVDFLAKVVAMTDSIADYQREQKEQEAIGTGQ